MDVTAATLNIVPTTTSVDRRTSLALRAGEVVEATVVVTRAGQLTLELGGMRVQAQSGLIFEPGQRLKLQVTSADDTPVLRVLDAAVQDPALAIQSRGLRAALPYQLPIAPLLASLAQLTQSDPTAALPAPVAQLVKTFLAQLPPLEHLTQPEQLQQWVAGSGLFLESKLAHLAPGEPLAADLKAGLLRLEDGLQQIVRDNRDGGESPATPAPSKHGAVTGDTSPEALAKLTLRELDSSARLAGEVRGAVAHLEVRQLTALNTLPEGLVVNLDLPVRVENTIRNHEMRISQDESSPDGHGGYLRPWTAKLSFDLPGIGRVHCRVSVTRDVAVQLWTERADAAPLFNRYLDELRDSLAHAGLVAGRLSCQPGQPPVDPTPRPAVTLVDERV